MARRPALEIPSRSVYLSNSFIFKQFRTLSRNGAITSPFSSIACALFSMQWRGRGDSLLSRLTSLPRASAKGHESPATKRASDKDASPERAQRVEGSRSSAKSCICHRSEKSPAKSFRCHTSKNALPQTLCLPHLRPPPPPASLGILYGKRRTMSGAERRTEKESTDDSIRKRQSYSRTAPALTKERGAGRMENA